MTVRWLKELQKHSKVQHHPAIEKEEFLTSEMYPEGELSEAFQ